jgi:hypothetical protein
LLLAAAAALTVQSLRRPQAFFSPANLLHGAGLLSLFGILLYGILRAGFGFPHYLMLLVVPSTLAAGWTASLLLPEAGTSASPGTPLSAAEAAAPSSPAPAAKKSKAARTRSQHPTASASPDSPAKAPSSADAPSRLPAGIALAALLLCLVQAKSTASIYSKNARLLAPWGEEASPLADALKPLAQPGDSLCIWGWYPKLHVFTQIRPATRFAVANLPADPEPERNPTLRAFLSDVQAAKPAFFVDASDEFVFPGTPPGSQPRHQSFPAFSRWIQAEYTLVASPQTHPSRRPILIYRRK